MGVFEYMAYIEHSRMAINRIQAETMGDNEKQKRT